MLHALITPRSSVFDPLCTELNPLKLYLEAPFFYEPPFELPTKYAVLKDL